MANSNVNNNTAEPMEVSIPLFVNIVNVLSFVFCQYFVYGRL